MAALKSLFDREFLNQESHDSASPSGLSSVFHRFDEAGEYAVNFLRSDQVIKRVLVAVTAEGSGKEPLPKQVSIDLCKVLRPGEDCSKGDSERRLSDERGQRFEVAAQGYVAFTASKREGEYAVVVRKTDEQGESALFDSRRLDAEDFFAVTLIRPGTYSITNVVNGTEGKITVTYPIVGNKPYRPPEPVSIECTAGGFSKKTIDLKPAQGIIFRINTPSRIKIDLVEPDDGPSERKPIAEWRNLAPKPRQQKRG